MWKRKEVEDDEYVLRIKRGEITDQRRLYDLEK